MAAAATIPVSPPPNTPPVPHGGGNGSNNAGLQPNPSHHLHHQGSQDAANLDAQQAQHYETLDGAFAADVAARAQAEAHAQAGSAPPLGSEQSDGLDNGLSDTRKGSPDTPVGEDSKGPRVARNAEGRIVCPVPACAAQGISFDRKCEWSKHMDKHERPYVCTEPGCEKLRGFTYSGGLLRHQREVHRKHGGPKEMLMCPFPYCKRNVGTGFTRKENLHEHIRRVHRGAPEASAAPSTEGPPSAETDGSQQVPLSDGQNGRQLAAHSAEQQQQQQQQQQQEQQAQQVQTPQQDSPYPLLTQDTQDQDQSRLIALQRSVQTHVPHTNKSRKRKASSSVHDETTAAAAAAAAAASAYNRTPDQAQPGPAPVADMHSHGHPSNHHPMSHELQLPPSNHHTQQHQPQDSGASELARLELLRGVPPGAGAPISALGNSSHHHQSEEQSAEELIADNRRLRYELDAAVARLRELEGVVAIMSQQQDVRS